MLVVVFRRHVAAIEIGRSQPSPVQGRAHPPHQSALNILIEKFVLKIRKDSIATERVIGRRKTAARNGGNVIHLIQQASALALPDNLGARQLFQDAIGQGGSPCSTAGECQKYLQAVRISGVREISETIAALWIVMVHSRVVRVMSTADFQQNAGAEHECVRNSIQSHPSPSRGMLGADKAHLAISSLRMKTTPFCFWVYLINSSITLTRPGMPDILSCVLIDIMRRREAASA